MTSLKVLTIVAAVGLASGAWAQTGGSGGTGGGSSGAGGGTSGGGGSGASERGQIVPNTAPGRGDTTGTTRSGPMTRAECEQRWNSTQQSGGASLSGPSRDRYMADCTAGKM